MPFDRWPPLDHSEDDSFGPEDDVAAQDLDTDAPLVWVGPAGTLPDLTPPVVPAATSAARLRDEAHVLLDALQPGEPGDESSLHDRELDDRAAGQDEGVTDDVVDALTTPVPLVPEDSLPPEDDEADDTLETFTGDSTDGS